MSGRSAQGFLSRIIGMGAAVACLATPAGAFEALDGRVQAHGFFESQFRALSGDYGEDWDVAQWYQVFNVELEIDILPDGAGPIDLLQGYVRAEVRYDCVYSRGCGMFRGVNAYGDRAKSLPRRLSNAEQRTHIGAVERDENATGEIKDSDRRSDERVFSDFFEPGSGRTRTFSAQTDVLTTTDPIPLSLVNGYSTLAGSAGSDGVVGDPGGQVGCIGARKNAGVGGRACRYFAGGQFGAPIFGTDGTKAKNDDPFEYIFERFDDFRFTQVNARGGSTAGLATRVFGPWRPKNFVKEGAALADKVNPFDDTTRSPVLAAAVYNGEVQSQLLANAADPLNPTEAELAAARSVAQQVAHNAKDIYAGVIPEPFYVQTAGAGNSPFKPVPTTDPGRFAQYDSQARGIYYTNPGLRNALGDLDNPQFNFRESERAWNRGASQRDEKELKEAYLDIELLDSTLWLRLGKQSIVWGKTELFRTTDQFNPQDLALASLPSLEESRISLWAARGVYSFYTVGPFDDVRVELAFNFDDYEPADLGACGEAYTPNLVCEITFGMFANGTAGLGVAGVNRPDDPWDDIKGWEVGGRVEWRWERFSFAVMDFYGYNDTPTPIRISTFERNVDPDTGRPRAFLERGDCVNGNEDACLKQGPFRRKDVLKANRLNPLLTAGPPLAKAATDSNGNQVTFNRRVDCTRFRNQHDVNNNPTDSGIFDDNCFRRNNSLALVDNNALDFHHVNQQVYAMICSTTIGFSSLDPASCAQSVFGSNARPSALFGLASIGQFIGATLAGDPGVASFVLPVLINQVQAPLVTLSADPGDLDNPGGCKASFSQYGAFLPGGAAPEAGRPDCGSGGAGTFFAVTLGSRLSPEQEALMGCGPFWGTQCDDDGVDLMNMEASAVIQSFIGAEGTFKNFTTAGIVDNRGNLVRPNVAQPGTVGFKGGPLCSFGTLVSNKEARRRANDKSNRLPGCYGLRPNGASFQANYDVNKDGDPTAVTWGGLLQTPLRPDNTPLLAAPGSGIHPFTGQPWQNEMAVVSWNFQVLVVTQSAELTDDLANLDAKGATLQQKVNRAYSFKPGKCSFVQPQFCSTPEALFAVLGTTRSTVSAGGNGRFGRRTFQWHSGGQVVLEYEKRNVLGFSMDFAEDITKSNWGMEFTWIEGLSFGDADQYDGLSSADTFNLTISVDRPTFINFLNANRTFFINSQWFFQYVSGYEQGFAGNGPYNILGTFAVSTGYYQDRLLPSVVFVYDVQSVSGAALPQVTYRYDENFSISVGAAIFMGREQLADRSVNPAGGVSNLQGRHPDKVAVENGLAVVRDRDEVFVRLRYTF